MPDVSDPAPEWGVLSLPERRVLGVLVEKQKTAKNADTYPLSLNAITAGSNQKSNRDPVTDFDEDHVEQTLNLLQRRGLVSKITGGRVDRWKHLLYEAWGVNAVEMAVLAELLLRGPQSEGDLRGRADRMDAIADLETLRGILKLLAERKLVSYVTPADRRGAAVTHGFHPPAELAAAKAKFGALAVETPASVAPAADVVGPLEARLGEAFEEIAGLKNEVRELRQQFEDFKRQLGS